MNPFRQLSKASKLSITFGLVFALACLLVEQTAHRIESQPLSVASDLWHSVAANNSLTGKRVKDNRDVASENLPDDWFNAPVSIEPIRIEWPLTSLAKPFLPLDSSCTSKSYCRPQLRAPPLV